MFSLWSSQNEINPMIDCAKFSKLALFPIDGSYGFEMVSFFLVSLLNKFNYNVVESNIYSYLIFHYS